MLRPFGHRLTALCGGVPYVPVFGLVCRDLLDARPDASIGWGGVNHTDSSTLRLAIPKTLNRRRRRERRVDIGQHLRQAHSPV